MPDGAYLPAAERRADIKTEKCLLVSECSRSDPGLNHRCKPLVEQLRGPATATDLIEAWLTFTWCMTAIDWGWSIEETARKLLEVSEKARECVQLKDEGYPLMTAQNAAAEVERNDQKRGRA